MNDKIWLRSEKKLKERRTPLTPKDAKKLIEAGAEICVEDNTDRIFPTKEYEEVGCKVVEAHSWQKASKDYIILGLKEILDPQVTFEHRHIYFAHIYKGQQGAGEILNSYKRDGGQLFDLEYLTNADGRRIAAFGKWAGVAGAAFALDYFFWKHSPLAASEKYPSLRSFESIKELMNQIEKHQDLSDIKKPKAIIIGAKGRCGQGGNEVFQNFDLPVTEWDYEETKGGGPFKEICDHDIFVNAALITKKIPPFIDNETLSEPERKLSIIADVSCDPNSDINPIPIYNQHTSWENPFLSLELNKPLEIMSVDNLPSTLPLESSIDFSEQLTPHLLDLVTKKGSLPLPFENALNVFRDHLKDLG